MSLGVATVRARIVTILSAVSGIGQVHNRIRPTMDEASVNALCVSGGRINVWMVTLADADPFLTTNSARQPGRNPANHEMGLYKFVVHGWYAANDAASSETTFADLVERVIAAFRADKKLNAGQGTFVIDSGPLQWVDGQMRMMPPKDGGAVCHYARLTLDVFEQTEP